MIIRLLNEKSKPKAPYGNGYYVLYGENKVLGGPFAKFSEAEYYIESFNWIISIFHDEFNSRKSNNEERFYVEDTDQKKTIERSFKTEELAREWINMIIDLIEKYNLEKDDGAPPPPPSPTTPFEIK